MSGDKSWSEWVRFDSHKDILTKLWQRMLELGRLPAPDELPEEMASEIDHQLTSIRNAVRLAQVGFEPSSFNTARASRIDDLTVYFALNLFNQRQPYTKLPKELQRDVSVFFQSYKASQESAKCLLFSLGDPDVIYQACVESFENGVGFLDRDHSLQIHSASVEELPPALRTYIGCAEKLYGDVAQSDIVKVHIRSGKVTFLEYESFTKSVLPRLLNRIKINLRHQEVDYFNYQEPGQTQLLYQKSRYMTKKHQGYEAQRKFDQRLVNLGLFDFHGLGPIPVDFFATLESAGLQVRGRRIVKIDRHDVAQ